uniref:Protein translocase subunit SecA n=1 Tax=Plagiogramma staurophorum TaxID=1003089 RepID=A0A2U9NMI9_9STRA|nr:preprotein-translocase subunit a [Plagiogramma staurophorum]AWT38307.1 preprotein-translocase subunit a [Plagiogramma staurophorum]
MGKSLFKKNSIVNKYQQLITKINALENTLKLLNDDELRVKSFNLQKQYEQTKNLNSLISESFALTREASVRTLGLRHFDVQLLGGIVLNSGKIAEMKTGEGKTLVATLPAFLNALTKKGVHVVTVNNYLANRDQVSMGQIYRFLGLETGLIQQGMTSVERKENYNADITYVTNYEVVFDYLHDNMATTLKNIVLRPFNYSIIDEVDSILIDEAQTPLIIANPIKTSNNKYNKYVTAAEITNYLGPNIHFEVDEKNKNIILTQEGTKQIEKILKIQDLYDPRNPWIPFIINAIKANALYFNNVHYIIQNNRIIIVDEFTGRIMPDRRWGEGLHQAIEAKEKLPIRKSTETVASITYQNFFLSYPKLSGMTGTGKTAEIEFEKIYKLSVDEIPTARPNIRKDLPDFIYKDQFSKWNAIAEECNNISITGQPILIGTTTVEKSEMLAQLLDEYNLSYQVLNAKPENVRKESEIVAQAGKKEGITIATNMAGRGTDIILGGNIKFTIQKELYSILTFTRIACKKQRNNIFDVIKGFDNVSQRFASVLISLVNNKKFLNLSSIDILRILRENDRISTPKVSYQCSVKFLVNELVVFYKKRQKQDQKIVKNLGGLYIVGTERNDSQRVDNQLRGRCGRQGDPGTSRFFLSLDDTLLRLFGSPNIQKFMQTQFFDDSPLESNLLTKSLNAAQKRVEERAYEQRKNLFEYDDVLNKQRQTIYYERRKILESNSIRSKIFQYSEQSINDSINNFKHLSRRDQKRLFNIFFDLLDNLRSQSTFLFPNNSDHLKKDWESRLFKNLRPTLYQEVWLDYYIKDLELQSYEMDSFESIERHYLLSLNDFIWKEHLQKMTLLREAVGWRGYGQRNPLYEYKEEAYVLFRESQQTLRQLVLHHLKRSSIL